MQLLLTGALVPHAPVLLPEVNGSGGAGIRDAAASLDLAGADALIVVSPHAAADLVYLRAEGDLSAFGIVGPKRAAETDPALAGRIAEGWSRVTTGGTLDHGVVVPLAILDTDLPVVAVGLAEAGNRRPSETIASGSDLAGAIRDATGERSVVVVVSAHGSAALSARAPLTERPEGHRLQAAIEEAFRSDLGALAEIPEQLWDAGGSCSAGAFAVLAGLFAGSTLEMIAQDAPFGVGYFVGRAK